MLVYMIWDSVIKGNFGLLSLSLVILFNQSVTTRAFPAHLKTAKITTAFEAGPDNDPKNYRSISQLSVFSKIFESLMKFLLIQYLERSLLNLAQFSFKR